MPECDDRVAMLEKLVGDQLELVPFADRLLQGAIAACFPSYRPDPGMPTCVIPDEVIGPRIGRPFEITLAEALVALFRSVNLAGHAALPSSAENPDKSDSIAGSHKGQSVRHGGPRRSW